MRKYFISTFHAARYRELYCCSEAEPDSRRGKREWREGRGGEGRMRNICPRGESKIIEKGSNEAATAFHVARPWPPSLGVSTS